VTVLVLRAYTSFANYLVVDQLIVQHYCLMVMLMLL